LQNLVVGVEIADIGEILLQAQFMILPAS